MQKSFLCVLFLCLFLALSGQAQSVNTSNLLKQLLDLPAPAPKLAEEVIEPKKTEREEEFYSDDKIPSDDAPIEDLVEYWAQQNNSYSRLEYQIAPSEKTLARLLEYCEENPEAIANFLSLLPSNPDIAEKVKKIYDLNLEADQETTYLRDKVRDWLKFNSKYYLDELVKDAENIRDGEEYVSNDLQSILRALGKLDWDRAKPIIDKLENDSSQPYSQVLAKWVIYQHALDTEDASLAERYRSELQKIVEDKNATPGQRDLAMDSLVLTAGWNGRDEWYMSLLEDETLLDVQENGYTGLTTLVSMSPPGKWTETMIKLTKSPSLAVRSAAVRNLMDIFEKDRKDILEALLPWLSNPDWAKSSNSNERLSLIQALAEADMPGAVPGLISVVQNEKDEFRGAAAKALAAYKNPSAIAALRFALLDEKHQEYQRNVIEALIACGGIGDDEQMASLEAFATLSSTPEGLERIRDYDSESYAEEEEDEGEKPKPLPLPVIIGKYLAELEEPGDGLAARAIERQKVLQKTKPAVAKVLAEIILKWKGRVIYLETLRQIKTGEADVDTVLTILANRRDVLYKIPNDIVAQRVSNGAGRGISACLAEDAAEFISILGQTDAETQIAMLSCARLIRTALPIDEVGELLKSPNKMLALAAERYLETEDSVQARTLVLAHRPGEALILGARQAFIPADVKSVYESPALDALFSSVVGNAFMPVKTSEIKKSEENLRAEIKENAEMLAIYAFLPEDESGQQVVRVYKDRIVFHFYEDAARYWERDLTAEEYEKFYQFLLENRIDSLPAFNTNYCDLCQANEFVMFGRNGGRRVFFRTNDKDLKVVENIRKIFESFHEGRKKLHYRLSDKIKGLEILLAEDKLGAGAVWKKDDDLRVLIVDAAKAEEIRKNLEASDKADSDAAIDNEDASAAQARVERRRKRREDVEYAEYSWRRVENGKLAAVVPQPLEMPILPDAAQIPEIDEIKQVPRQWQARFGNFEIRTGSGDNFLYKVSRSQSPVKIKEGSFSFPIVTPDGKWVVASNAEVLWNNDPGGISRINLQTGQEFKLNLPPANVFAPIAFIQSHNKILLIRARGRLFNYGRFSQYVNDESREAETKTNPSPKIPQYFLLDANTGATEPVKGEFRPLLEQTYRPLQPTGNAGEFWAAVYDAETKTTAIGRYSEKTFTFQPVTKIPDIRLTSMDIWVDEKQAKVYFTYHGHLLALPLKS